MINTVPFIYLLCQAKTLHEHLDSLWYYRHGGHGYILYVELGTKASILGDGREQFRYIRSFSDPWYMKGTGEIIGAPADD